MSDTVSGTTAVDSESSSSINDSKPAIPPVRTRYWYYKGQKYQYRDPSSVLKHPFYGPWSDYGSLTLRTLDENTIIALSQEIRRKPLWWEKMNNPEITSKWREEMKAQDVKDSIISYVLDELVFYRELREKTLGQFQSGCADDILYGDDIVPEELKEKLKKGVSVLEDVPEHEKDWHPGSNNQVLDLVHPSLYPLQYGITPVLPEGQSTGLDLQLVGFDATSPMPKFEILDMVIKDCIEPFGVSERFQWLPSIFNVSNTGQVTIESYINNLHPVEHEELYQPIADIFGKFIPALNVCLSICASQERIRIKPFVNENGLYDKDPDFGEDWDSYEEYLETRDPKIPEPKFTGVPELKEVNLNGRKLKVIVKLANIILTPENPDYKGGSWHVEGQINEDIVATALYYYDLENITESNLDFRAAYDDPPYEQGDTRGMKIVFGLEDEDQMTRALGSEQAIEDRLLVFPNMYQHHVAPFSLKDKSKPGHRKILCFFLVDPFNDKVIATDRVPPQQSSWWKNEIRNAGKLGELPEELFIAVIDQVEWPYPLSYAEKLREELMAERSIKVTEDDYDERPFYRQFSLCEH